MEKKKVVFLFGAGAEGNGQLGLPSGAEFKRSIILAKGVKNYYKKISLQGEYKIKNGKMIHHNEHSILYQTIMENIYIDKDFHKSNIYDDILKERIKTFFGLTKDEKESESSGNIFMLNEDDISVIVEYIKNKESKKIGKELSDKFSTIYKEKIYNLIVANNNDSIKNEFLEKMAFFSDVDSYFNYLRKPDLYKNEVARIMKIYFSAHKCIYDRIVKKRKIIKNREVFQKIINQAQEERSNEYKENEEIYYSMIRKYKEDFDLDIITTNYTNFAEKIIGVDETKIQYLHGRLDLFESIETKKIGKITDFKENETIFPYIFIQSGIKPIVSPFEIETFSDACKAIENADYLVILGYGLNSDDEHISTMIRYYLDKEGKTPTVFYLEYELKKDKEDNPVAKSSVANAMSEKYKEHFNICSCEVLNELLESIKSGTVCMKYIKKRNSKN